jgi:hypothetical protein
MGEVEPLAPFPAYKAANPSARAFVDLLASSTVMILSFWIAVALRMPSGTAGTAPLTRVCRRRE